ncbi:MAG: hypothetical protein K6F09_05675, partial [Clostridiales bacterium]|nr:hypothetical protein [Clostridiales bacterium]
MNQWSVLNSLRQLTALDEEGAADVLPLCRECIEEILPRLKSDLYENDPRAIRAAAALAYYKLTLK